MSTETTNKKIKIDNGTTFGRTYTDKAVDAKLPTDLIASANKLSLGVGNNALGNGVNLDGFTYDEATKTLKSDCGVSKGIEVITINRINGYLSDEQYNKIKANPNNYILFYNNSYYYLDGLTRLDNMDSIRYTTFSIIKSYYTYADRFYRKTIDILSNKKYTAHDNFVSHYINIVPSVESLSSSKTYILKTTGKNIKWVEDTPTFKSISLFSKHSILVPKDSADTNIDLYNHSITVGKPNDMYLNGFTFLFPSSSNLVVDSIQDLNTILGTTPRMIPVSGCYNPGTPILITRLNWKGSFSNSTLITTGGEEEDILATFTSIGDVVTNL